MPEQTVGFKIQRYKQGWPAPRYQRFEAAVDEDTTLLVALQSIRRDQDPSLALRHSCHHASCGTCGLKVNGVEELACVVNVLALGTAEVLVEPLDHAPLLADLVVEMGPFYALYATPGMAYLRASEALPQAETPGDVAAYTRFENCIECGLCVSACPVVEGDPAYLGPAAMAAAWRVVEEPRAADPAAALAWVDNEHGCWRCHAIFECTEVCPSEVYPGESIMALRQQLTRRKLGRLFGRASPPQAFAPPAD